MANHLRELVDCINSKKFGYWPMLDINRVKEAAGFVESMSGQAVCFAGGEMTDMQGISIITDLARLPYGCCWIEFHHNLSDSRVTIGIMAVQRADEIMGYIWHKDSQLGWTYFGAMRTKQGAKNSEIFDVGNDEADIAQMIMDYFLCFLSALNCTNVRRVEHKPDAKLQKARAKRGKQPLFSYWTLELTPGRAEDGQGLGGTHASPRLHLRRGHPRQYAPGKWTWVQPCVVGNKAAGMVHKDYAMVTQ